MPVFSGNVERWRPLVSKYFPSGKVDEALKIIELESGGNPTIQSGATYNGARERSFGLFQIHLAPDAHGGAISETDAKDPEKNIAFAAKLFNGSGWQPWTTSRTADFQSFTGGAGGGRGMNTPVGQFNTHTSGSGGEAELPPLPNIQDYYKNDPQTGERKFDSESYYYDLEQAQLARMRQSEINSAESGRSELSSYMDDLIAEYGAQIEAGKLTLSQGVSEFNRRMTAHDSAQEAFTKMVGYGLRPGATEYPQASFYEGLGLPRTTPSPISFDPFSMAMDIVNQTPRLDVGVPKPGFDVASQYENSPFTQALNIADQGAMSNKSVPSAQTNLPMAIYPTPAGPAGSLDQGPMHGPASSPLHSPEGQQYLSMLPGWVKEALIRNPALAQSLNIPVGGSIPPSWAQR